MSKTLSRKKYGLSYESNEKFFDEIADVGHGNSFHLLASDNLLEMIAFEEMVQFDTLYREPKKFSTPFRIFPTRMEKK